MRTEKTFTSSTMNALYITRAACKVKSIITLSIHFLLISVQATNLQKQSTEWPCTKRLATEWVRHPDDCSVYFICNFGQPLSMPKCPFGQVWGTKARNCVPQKSRWNDCNPPKLSKGTHNNFVTKQKPRVKYYPVSVYSTPATYPVYSVVDNILSTKTNHPTTRNSFRAGRPPATNRAPSTTLTTIKPWNSKPQPVQQDDKSQKVNYNSKRKPQPIEQKGDSQGIQSVTPTAKPWERKFQTSKHYDREQKVQQDWKKKSQLKDRWTQKDNPPKVQFTFAPRPSQHKVDSQNVQSTSPSRPPPMTVQQNQKKDTTRSPTVMSPFHPSSQKKYYTYPRRVKVTTKPKTPNRSTQPRKDVKPARPPWKTAVPTQEADTSTQRSPVRAMPTIPWTTKTTRQAPWKTEEEDDKLVQARTVEPSDWAIKPMFMRLPEGHPCGRGTGGLVSHPTQCHWFYNCTAAVLENVSSRDLTYLAGECRYPQLFDSKTSRCREFINVQCQDRFEPVDPCEYQAHQCRSSRCVPCHQRFGTCRDRANGIYPLHTSRWTPTFVTCFKQRNIAQDDCQAPTPLFSPLARDCVALTEVPKQHGGLRPDCSFRYDGFYPDEQGRCGIFFECQNKKFVTYDECPLGTVFDPGSVHCQPLQLSTPPCGEGPAPPNCSLRADGFHADPFGRCPYYFECQQSRFVQHHTCDFGSFDPLSQECIIPVEILPRPCGLLPNPCEGKPVGFHPDEASDCRRYVECSQGGILISRGACPEGSVFSTLSGRCDSPQSAPEPCGGLAAETCDGKRDGRYPATAQGCEFYVACRGGRVVGGGARQCRVEEGGVVFNEVTGRCESPHNVCQPCGYRWWGCARNLHR